MCERERERENISVLVRPQPEETRSWKEEESTDDDIPIIIVVAIVFSLLLPILGLHITDIKKVGASSVCLSVCCGEKNALNALSHTKGHS